MFYFHWCNTISFIFSATACNFHFDIIVSLMATVCAEHHNAIHCLGNRVWYSFCCNVIQSQQKCAIHFDIIISFSLLAMVRTIHFDTLSFSISAVVCAIHFNIIIPFSLSTIVCTIHFDILKSFILSVTIYAIFRRIQRILWNHGKGHGIQTRCGSRVQAGTWLEMQVCWDTSSSFLRYELFCERCSVFPFTCHLKIGKTFVLFQMWNWSLTVS